MFGSRDISTWSWHIFNKKWTWSKQAWCHGFTLMANVLFFFEIYHQFYATKLNVLIPWMHHEQCNFENFKCLRGKIASLINPRSNNRMKNKEKQNIGHQCESMTSHLLASSSLFVQNVSTSIANISRTEHGKWMKISPECLEYAPL